MPYIPSSEWLTAWLPALPHALQGRVDWYLVVDASESSSRQSWWTQWGSGYWSLWCLPSQRSHTSHNYGLLGTGVRYLWIARPCSPTCRVSHHHENKCEAACVPCNLLFQQLCGNLKQKTVQLTMRAQPHLPLHKRPCLGSIHYIQWLLM